LDALTACADESRRFRARRFLVGLSADELQFIAEFLGASVLDAAKIAGCSRQELAERIARFRSARAPRSRTPSVLPDEDHKTILLLEYLCRGGIQTEATQ
jgi:hypothetical protein